MRNIFLFFNHCRYLNYAKTLSSDRLALALIAVSGQGPVARRVLTDFSIKTMNNLTLLLVLVLLMKRNCV